MARRSRPLRQLIRLTRLIRAAFSIPALLLLAPAWHCACADPSPTPAAQAAQLRPKVSPRPDVWNDARKLFDQMSPEQQQKFFDNLAQWKAMSPEEQALLRDQQMIRSEKMAQEIQDAISKSGLQLDDDRREVYALRYTQERRKIEETLRKETQAKRQAMVADMLTRLKVEFSSPSPDISPAH